MELRDQVETICNLRDDFSVFIDGLWDDEFDPQVCKDLLIRTYDLFYSYHKEAYIPRITLIVYEKLVELMHFPTALGEDFEACQIIAEGLSESISKFFEENFDQQTRIVPIIFVRTGKLLFDLTEFDLEMLKELNEKNRESMG